MQHVLALFIKPNRSDATLAHLENDYDLQEAHRRLLNQTTALQMLEREQQERRTA